MFLLPYLLLATACRPGTGVEYPLVRQYAGVVAAPEDASAPPAPKDDGTRLHVHRPDGWEDVSETHDGEGDGTVAIFARSEGDPMLVAIHATYATEEAMGDSMIRVIAQLGDVRAVRDVELEDDSVSFSWSSAPDWNGPSGHVKIVRMDDLPGVVLEFIGFSMPAEIETLRETVHDMVDSAEIVR